MARSKKLLSVFLIVTFLFSMGVFVGNAEETWNEADIPISDNFSELLALIEAEDNFDYLSDGDKALAAELVLDVVEELDEDEIAAIWPLVGQWVTQAINWLAGRSNSINHIINNVQHLWHQAGVFTANQLLPILQQVLQNGNKVYHGNDLWYIHGSWNGWAVTIVGKIINGSLFYHISSPLLSAVLP